MEKLSYKRPPPGDLARRIWSNFAAIMYTDVGTEELRWESLSDGERNALTEAVDIVLTEEFEKVSDSCYEVLSELMEERDQRQSERIVDAEYADVGTHEALPERPCYACGRNPVWGEELLCQSCKS